MTDRASRSQSRRLRGVLRPILSLGHQEARINAEGLTGAEGGTGEGEDNLVEHVRYSLFVVRRECAALWFVAMK
jgi:hypothetical protein